jgi:hypothetical protein
MLMRLGVSTRHWDEAASGAFISAITGVAIIILNCC